VAEADGVQRAAEGGVGVAAVRVEVAPEGAAEDDAVLRAGGRAGGRAGAR
jgi:hypothetical protein